MSKRLGATAIQTALYASIDGGITTSVYDFVPEGTDYPYVVIGEGSGIDGASENKDTFGREASCQIDIFTRQQGFKEAKDIAEEITALMSSLTITGFSILHWTPTTHFIRESDGKTRRVVLDIDFKLDQTS